MTDEPRKKTSVARAARTSGRGTGPTGDVPVSSVPAGDDVALSGSGPVVLSVGGGTPAAVPTGGPVTVDIDQSPSATMVEVTVMVSHDAVLRGQRYQTLLTSRVQDLLRRGYLEVVSSWRT